MITQFELKDRLSYDPGTGVFIWIKVYRNKTRLLGKEAGGVDCEGYRIIKISGRSYRAHQLAWLYVHGRYPAVILDHRDGARDNNAITNLREVTFSGNSQNQRHAHTDSAHGLIGVDLNKKKKRFRARIMIAGKRKTLGGFATLEAAHEAYLQAKRQMHATCSI